MSEKEKNIAYLKKLKAHYELRVKKLELQEVAARYRLKTVLPLSSRGHPHYQVKSSPVTQLTSECDDGDRPCNADIGPNKTCSPRGEEKSLPTGKEEKSNIARETNDSYATLDSLDLSILTSINQLIKWERDTKRRIARMIKEEEVLMSSITGNPPPYRNAQEIAAELATPSARYSDIRVDVERMMEVVNHLASKVKEPGCPAQEDFLPNHNVSPDAELSSNLQGVVEFVNEKMPQIADSLASIEKVISKQETQVGTNEETNVGEVVCVEDSAESSVDREINKMDTMRRNIDLVVNHLKVSEVRPTEEFESINHDLSNILEIFHSAQDDSCGENSSDAVSEVKSKVAVTEQVESAMEMVDKIIARASQVVCESIIKETEASMLKMNQLMIDEQPLSNIEEITNTIKTGKKSVGLVEKSQLGHNRLESTAAHDMFSCDPGCTILTVNTNIEQPMLPGDLRSESTKAETLAEATVMKRVPADVGDIGNSQTATFSERCKENMNTNSKTHNCICKCNSFEKGEAKDNERELEQKEPVEIPLLVTEEREIPAGVRAAEQAPAAESLASPASGQSATTTQDRVEQVPSKPLSTVMQPDEVKNTLKVVSSKQAIKSPEPKRIPGKQNLSELPQKTTGPLRNPLRTASAPIAVNKLRPTNGFTSLVATNTTKEKSSVNGVTPLTSPKTSKEESPAKGVTSLTIAAKTRREGGLAKDLTPIIAAKSSKDKSPVKGVTSFMAAKTQNAKTQMKSVASSMAVKNPSEKSTVKGDTSWIPARILTEDRPLKGAPSFMAAAKTSRKGDPVKGVTSLTAPNAPREESKEGKGGFTSLIATKTTKEKNPVKGVSSFVAANMPKENISVKGEAIFTPGRTSRDDSPALKGKTSRKGIPVKGVSSFVAANIPKENISAKEEALFTPRKTSRDDSPALKAVPSFIAAKTSGKATPVKGVPSISAPNKSKEDRPLKGVSSFMAANASRKGSTVKCVPSLDAAAPNRPRENRPVKAVTSLIAPNRSKEDKPVKAVPSLDAAPNRSKEERPVKGVTSFIAAKTSRKGNPVKAVTSLITPNRSKEGKPVKGVSSFTAPKVSRKRSPMKSVPSITSPKISRKGSTVKCVPSPTAPNRSRKSSPVKGLTSLIEANKSKEKIPVQGVTSLIAANPAREESSVKSFISFVAEKRSREESPVNGVTSFISTKRSREESSVKGFISFTASNTSSEEGSVKGFISFMAAKTSREGSPIRGVTSLISAKTTREKSPVKEFISFVAAKTSREENPEKTTAGKSVINNSGLSASVTTTTTTDRQMCTEKISKRSLMKQFKAKPNATKRPSSPSMYMILKQTIASLGSRNGASNKSSKKSNGETSGSKGDSGLYERHNLQKTGDKSPHGNKPLATNVGRIMRSQRGVHPPCKDCANYKQPSNRRESPSKGRGQNADEPAEGEVHSRNLGKPFQEQGAKKRQISGNINRPIKEGTQHNMCGSYIGSINRS